MRGPRPPIVNATSHPLSQPAQLGSPSTSSFNTPSQSTLSFRQNSFGLRPSVANPGTDQKTEFHMQLPSTSKTPNTIATTGDIDDALTPPTDLPQMQGQDSSPSKTVTFMTGSATFRGASSLTATVQDSQPASGVSTPTKTARPRPRPKSKSKPSPSSPASASPFNQTVFPVSPDHDVPKSVKIFQETGGAGGTTSSAFLSGLNRDDGGKASNTAGGGYGFGSSEMTYDSFWSSHSSASTARLSGL